MNLMELAGLLESAGYKVHRGKTVLTVVEKGFAGKKVYVQSIDDSQSGESSLLIKRFNWRDLTVPAALLIAILADRNVQLWEVAIAALVLLPFLNSLIGSASLKEKISDYINRYQSE